MGSNIDRNQIQGNERSTTCNPTLAVNLTHQTISTHTGSLWTANLSLLEYWIRPI